VAQQFPIFLGTGSYFQPNCPTDRLGKFADFLNEKKDNVPQRLVFKAAHPNDFPDIRLES